MESFEQHIAEALADHAPQAGPARILLVGGDPAQRSAIVQALRRQRHACAWAAGLVEARAALTRSRHDVIVLHDQLPDGPALDLLPFVQRTSPATKTVLTSHGISIEQSVQAMRSGAVDCVLLPFDDREFAQRVESALIKGRVDQQREERLARLKKVCHELNQARRDIAEQVDSLCESLASVYQDMAGQMNDVALASEFRTLLRQELDVEDLLRTTLEYMLAKTGPTNAAVFLPDSSGPTQTFGLGAYVNCDCPRESVAAMLDHLCHAICPQMADEPDMVSFADAREFAQWIGSDAGGKQAAGADGVGVGGLANSQVIAFSCRHKDDCLAVFVLFRDQENPFDEKLAGVLDTMRTIIAEQLKHVIRIHHRGRPSWPKEAADGDLDYRDDLGGGFSGHEGGLAA